MAIWDNIKGVFNKPKPAVKPEVQGPPTPPPMPDNPQPEPEVGFKPADEREAKILLALHPVLRKRLEVALQKWREAGLAVYIFEGLRTIERQRELYAKGRDKNGVVISKKDVVTNAKPGSSFHNYGIAIDMVFDGDTAKPGVQWSWKEPDAKWKLMGKIGQECGLEWAGAWRSFPEAPHFQLSVPGLGWRDFLRLHMAGGMTAVWDKVSTLFPNG